MENYTGLLELPRHFQICVEGDPEKIKECVKLFAYIGRNPWNRKSFDNFLDEKAEYLMTSKSNQNKIDWNDEADIGYENITLDQFREYVEHFYIGIK